ncbi:CsbD family protein [Adhaeribacter terreus]|uniref:CsbD family protein n=1 Tax=Adhaeribacter terreus TaxID=529703 RepID=A0ABW0E735_9BACT
MNSGHFNKGGKKVRYENAANANSGRGQYSTGVLGASKKKKKKYTSDNGSSNKIWMAALAGASAGVIAGLLMAPESGKSTIDSLKRSAMRLGDQMDETFRVAMNKMENMGLTRAGDSLQIQGNWDQVKGKMKSQYGDLTDQDLAYLEGQEDKFLGNLETKLGKSKRELIRWINSLA